MRRFVEIIYDRVEGIFTPFKNKIWIINFHDMTKKNKIIKK